MSEAASRSAWRSAEKIAAMLEQVLTPDATVQHNVFLPVIGKPSRRARQCDVVITYGNEPRQSIAIVEVQKRKTKPDITTFHGWHRKMQEVGAQQLICISELGYPQSVIDDVATRIGPTVKLMILQDFERKKYDGIVMLPFMVYKDRKWEPEAVGSLKFARNDNIKLSELTLNFDEKLFSISTDGDGISFFGLISTALNNAHRDIPDNATVELKFTAQHDLWIRLKGAKLRVTEWVVKVRTLVNSEIRNVPVSQFVYRQEMVEGSLAWIASIPIDVNSKQQELYLVFKPDQAGFLQQVTALIRARAT